MAEAMRQEFNWATDEEWRRAGPRIHTLQQEWGDAAGIVRGRAASPALRSLRFAGMLDHLWPDEWLRQPHYRQGDLCSRGSLSG
jgi:hypothetical protein